MSESKFERFKKELPSIKDAMQIVRDFFVICGAIWALIQAPPIVAQKAKETKSNAEAASDQLRAFRLKSIQQLSEEVSKLDEELKLAPWKGGLTWDRLKAVRDLKQQELIRIENELRR